MTKHYTKQPGGKFWTISPKLCEGHTLIAGITGSGKSVLLNRILGDCLAETPGNYSFVLIDPKRVELRKYATTQQCDRYASEPHQIPAALDYAIAVMEQRYRQMARSGQTKYEGYTLLVVIDELADLMTTQRKVCLPKLQRIAQLGRAARVVLIACTQAPNRRTLDANLLLNFQNRVALHCAFPIESRQIIGTDEAVTLPQFGQGYLYTASGEKIHLTEIPPADPDELRRRLNFWKDRSLRKRLALRFNR